MIRMGVHNSFELLVSPLCRKECDDIDLVVVDEVSPNGLGRLEEVSWFSRGMKLLRACRISCVFNKRALVSFIALIKGQRFENADKAVEPGTRRGEEKLNFSYKNVRDPYFLFNLFWDKVVGLRVSQVITILRLLGILANGKGK